MNNISLLQSEQKTVEEKKIEKKFTRKWTRGEGEAGGPMEFNLFPRVKRLPGIFYPFPIDRN